MPVGAFYAQAVESDTTQPLPQFDDKVYRAHETGVAAFLVYSGLECKSFDGLGFLFADPKHVAADLAREYHTTSVNGAKFKRALERILKLESAWRKESEPVDPFVQIPKSFAEDKELSAMAKALGLLLASMSDQFSEVYVSTRRLQAMLKKAVRVPQENGNGGKKPKTAVILKNIGRDTTTTARAELVKGGYLEVIRAIDDEGQFEECRYRVTPKLRRRSRKS